ncbi:MAG: tRNA (N(6)-L-threonylcarbamoyladenosine(37)-C(2))-methylthiotransferase MtaB [Lachnospiraceae bacterium]|jgi:threonylcarbamoyladenosine tRNA methylthiotransferase MtaB|nr:tRNA (N(6)-L-threonylcarbamoyladenosine(37)-C(2))-methylthiotransferase MtaB [Lachnospiraceae bacterium]
MRKVALHNLGCKVNQYEIDAMSENLENNGYEIIDFNEKADIYIVNTCTVTNIADKKSRQMLRRAKKENPEAIVVATGCYTEVDDTADQIVDIVVGNNKKSQIVEILNDYLKSSTRENVVIKDESHQKVFEQLGISHTSEHTRAYLKVEDGCNSFCSYCIIPFARGRVRSNPINLVMKEAKALANKGYKEVVLTGIHLSSYGIDINSNLLELIQNIATIEGIERIRLGSLEPRLITEEFAKEISKIDKICPQFHLALQSGSDTVLKRMNRKYNTSDYKEAVRLVRKYFDNPALTTDIIVGFPGETEEEFIETYDFVDNIDFYETHIFKYSSRKGTKASKMSDQINGKIKDERSHKLLELDKNKRKKYENSFLNNNLQVLFETKEVIDGYDYYIGHSKEYIKVKEKSSLDLVNQIKSVKLTDLSQIV